MNAKEIRDQFVKLSGRFDLVNADGSDNGANWFINAGQRFLDRMLGDFNLEDPAKNSGKLVLTLAQGNFFKTIYMARAIASVLLIKSDGETVSLTRETANTLRLNYNTQTVTQAQPEYFAPVNTRYVANEEDSTAAAITNITTTLNSSQDYNGILFLPPADQAYYLEVQGLFYSLNLNEDDAESYWSVVHPDILVAAGLYKLEVFYRNTQGARDFYDALMRDISGIDMDVVAQQAFNSNQMLG